MVYYFKSNEKFFALMEIDYWSRTNSIFDEHGVSVCNGIMPVKNLETEPEMIRRIMGEVEFVPERDVPPEVRGKIYNAYLDCFPYRNPSWYIQD